MQPERAIDGLNLDALNGALQAMDPAEIKGRKRQLNRLYHEALLCCTSDKGISFTDMLLMLAQYKLVQPETALK